MIFSNVKLTTAVLMGLLALVTAGCVDDSGYIDPRPQYDSQGEPNFDTHGNYIGCHGIGCEVDDPDA